MLEICLSPQSCSSALPLGLLFPVCAFVLLYCWTFADYGWHEWLSWMCMGWRFNLCSSRASWCSDPGAKFFTFIVGKLYGNSKESLCTLCIKCMGARRHGTFKLHSLVRNQNGTDRFWIGMIERHCGRQVNGTAFFFCPKLYLKHLIVFSISATDLLPKILNYAVNCVGKIHEKFRLMYVDYEIHYSLKISTEPINYNEVIIYHVQSFTFITAVLE